MFNPNVTPYSPGNIDDTTRMLIGLKQKGQLQQYVQQHSQDPNLVALALYVNNLDNAARGAQAMQAQQQSQPTVLEEKMAQMAPQQLPEDVGIGALPVQGMDNFADGGIVGYAGGGAGPNPASGPAGRLAYDNEPVLRMAKGGIVAFDGGGVASLGSVPSYSATNPNAAFTDFLRKMGLSAQEFIAASPQAQKSLRDMFTSGAAEAPAAPAASAAPAATATGGYGSALRSAATKYLGPLSAVASNLFFTSPEEMDTLRKADAKRAMENLPAGTFKGYGDTSDIDQMIEWGAKQRPPAAAAGPAGAGAGAPSDTQAAAAARPVQPGADPVLDAYRKAMEQFAPAKGQSREEYMAEREKYQGKDPAEAQLERLTKMDEMAQMEREDARNFALMRAGFGMMASKSPFAMVGIGEGAQSGLTDYQSAIKDLKAAERERQKLRMDAERAQYAAKGARWEDFDKIQEKRAEGQDAFNRTMAQGIGTLMGHEMQNKTSLQVAELQRRAAGAGGNLGVYTALGKGDVLKGLQLFAETMGPEAKGETAIRQSALTTWAANPLLQSRFPNFEDYYKIAAGKSPTTGSASGASTGSWGTATVVNPPR